MKTVAIVRFSPKAKLSQEQYKRSLKEMMPVFEAAPGLDRKFFCASGSGSAGIYEWRTQDAAEAFYDEDWRQLMGQFATDVSIEYLTVRAELDNTAGVTEFYI